MNTYDAAREADFLAIEAERKAEKRAKAKRARLQAAVELAEAREVRCNTLMRRQVDRWLTSRGTEGQREHHVARMDTLRGHAHKAADAYKAAVQATR